MFAPDSTTIDISPTLWTRRRWIAAAMAGAAISGCAGSLTNRRPAPRVLFVCQFGTAKSPIAREIFRRAALNRGLAAEAWSRGLTLEDHISPRLRQTLLADGIRTDADPQAVLTTADWQRADIVVSFNPLPPGVMPADQRDWSAVPSFNDDYVSARADLDRRISALLDELMLAHRRR
jgi:hypothetical protein